MRVFYINANCVYTVSCAINFKKCPVAQYAKRFGYDCGISDKNMVDLTVSEKNKFKAENRIRLFCEKICEERTGHRQKQEKHK